MAKKVSQLPELIDPVGDEYLYVAGPNKSNKFKLSGKADVNHRHKIDEVEGLTDFVNSVPTLVTSNPLLITNGVFVLPSTAIGDIVWNTALVFLDINPSTDLNPNGSLLMTKDYCVEEHMGLSIDTDKQTVRLLGSGGLLNNLYACVSYLTLVTPT
jgi:hypothetical protein